MTTILVKAGNSTYRVENCKQLMSCLSKDEREEWYAHFAILGINKRCLTGLVNSTIKELADIRHYNCDKTPCRVGYILSYVAELLYEKEN